MTSSGCKVDVRGVRGPHPICSWSPPPYNHLVSMSRDKCSQAFPIYCCSFAFVHYTEDQKGGKPGNKAGPFPCSLHVYQKLKETKSFLLPVKRRHFVPFVFSESHVQTDETILEDQTKQSHTPDSENPATSSAKCSNSSSPLPSEVSQKPPFGCGCGSCTLFSFIERGCPTPFSSKNTFPYLKLSGLTDEQQENLKERLRFETREIMMRFQELVSATIKSLIRRNVSVDELVPHVMTLGAFNPVLKNPPVPLFQDCLKELKAAGTISKAFMVLNEYFSFFNYDIIEHIIKELGTDEDKAELQKYKDNFNQYARRRIFECGPHFGPESETDHADIFVKLDSRYDNYTVAEIKGFCRKLSETLHLSSKGVLHLCRVDKGCIQLTFQVPLFVQHEIFPLSREQERALSAIDVIKLICGKYQFLVSCVLYILALFTAVIEAWRAICRRLV